jgi:hypothetical protein
MHCFTYPSPEVKWPECEGVPPAVSGANVYTFTLVPTLLEVEVNLHSYLNAAYQETNNNTTTSVIYRK